MNESAYKNFYDQVGKTNGWDFSKVKVVSEGVTWDFNEEIKKRTSSSGILLDIGTGGGENALRMAPFVSFLVGIDRSIEMIQTARFNLEKANLSNVSFFQMSAHTLKFPAECFDMVTSRHAPFYSSVVADVLKKGGYFITQQVGEEDKLNLKKAFNRGTSAKEYGALQVRYIRELKEAGFSDVQFFEYNASEYFQTPEDLIFLLKHTPTIPNFGQEEKDFEILDDFIQNNLTEKGIRTNAKRFLILAKK